MRKHLLSLALLFGALSVPSMAANQGAPQAGVASQGVHSVFCDGNGNCASDPVGAIGYRVFEDSGNVAAVLVTDLSGTAPTKGLLHQVCMNAVAGHALVVDAGTAVGVTLTSANAVAPQLVGNTTGVTCQILDAQFNTGLVVVTDVTATNVYLYWRPLRGS